VYQAKLTREGDNRYPSWSADGKKIVYASNQTRRWDIWIMSVDGSTPHDLLRKRGWLGPTDSLRSGCVAEDADPSWSPDGKNIIFHSRWTSEQGILVFKDEGYAKTIFIVSEMGFDLAAVSTSPGAKIGASNEMQTTWSQDAGKIAFVSDRSGTLDIWIFNFKGFTAPTGAY